MDSRVARWVPSDNRTRLMVVLLALAALLATTPRVPREPEPAAPAGSPSQLDVPALGVQAPVVPIEMDAAGVLTPPADVNTVGWWQRSAEPGAGEGQTLITGHTVRVGDGAMDRIGELGSGARVEVRGEAGSAAYEVTDVVTYDRDQVAAQAQELFGQNREDGRLVLVTCTDWNGEVWERNIIVLAQPV